MNATAASAVAGLAPWLPPTEPVDQLAGRRVLLAHGTADRVTSPAETWAYAARARSVTDTATIEVRGGEHTMVRRGPLWHRMAAELDGAIELVAGAFSQDAERSRQAGVTYGISADRAYANFEEMMERVVRLARHWVAGINDETAQHTRVIGAAAQRKVGIGLQVLSEAGAELDVG